MDKDEIIEKQSLGKDLSYDELSFFFNGYLNDKIDDHDATLMLSAICDKGMTDKEIFDLTDIFLKSGEMLELPFRCVDKHSTGGVGDKTTIALIPILASLDIKVAKLSGRALGYTGGTIDKLESIKGFKTKLTKKEFIKQISEINASIISQTDDLCPMDKKVYALRDVTGTTSSIPLIASSIMSKKIASGSMFILIDIKIGKGALISNRKDGERLANIMIAIGKKYKREVVCMLTNMDNPLGDNIGNQLEVEEVIDILKGKRSSLTDLIIDMAAIIVAHEKKISKEMAKNLVNKSLDKGQAIDKLKEIITYQKGDINSFEKLVCKQEILSPKTGYIKSIDALIVGLASMKSGAGRVKKEDKINYQAGVVLNKNVSSYVKKGDVLCSIYGNKINEKDMLKAYTFTKFKPKKKDIIIKVLS